MIVVLFLVFNSLPKCTLLESGLSIFYILLCFEISIRPSQRESLSWELENVCVIHPSLSPDLFIQEIQVREVKEAACAASFRELSLSTFKMTSIEF